MAKAEKIFDALGSTARRKILAYLAEGPLTAGEIAARFEMSQPSISKHLSILEAAGLVWRKREGQFIRYGMEQETLTGTLLGFMQEVCPPSRALRRERRAGADEDSAEEAREE